MSTDKLTRCPHCKAAFKVSESQLTVANGRVRCGACMNVFDALAYSLGDARDAAPEKAPEQPEKSFQENLDAFANQSGETPDLDDELIQDNPDQDMDNEDYSGDESFGGELSTSFMELEEQSGHDSAASFLDEADLRDETPDDESWARQMLEDEAKAEHTKMHEALDEPAPLRAEAETMQAFEHREGSAGPDTDGFEFGSHTDGNEHISFYYEEPDETPKRSKIASAALIGFNTLLVLVLILLASWFHYEKLAKYPQVAKLYQSGCELLGCKLPELSDVTKIRSHNLVVRSHPTTRNALIIDAVITNEADYAQDFPDLALYFSDINNQTVAQKLIKPEQYLSADILEWQQIPSEQPIHISLEIVDPGKEAVNYTLKFFPQKKDQVAP